MRLSIDGFMLSMLLAILLALLFPQIGISGGPLHLEWVTRVGVALIFFFSGAGLSMQKLRHGVTQWRLHLFVQLFTFAVFPLIGLLVTSLAGRHLPEALGIGFFYLCVLPSTVASSIALTTMARGNVVGAIFNATASSLIGMVLTPLYVSLWLHTAGPEVSLPDQLMQIGLQLLLPFVLGQVLRPWLGAWVTQQKPMIGRLDRSVIVLIVFNAFCNATAAGIWSRYGIGPLLLTALMTTALLLVVLALTRFTARRLKFSVEDEITAMFCGSKKSLAVGAPMAAVIFADSEILGLIMLPLILYHQIQLIVVSVLARRYAARPD